MYYYTMNMDQCVYEKNDKIRQKGWMLNGHTSEYVTKGHC